MAYLVGLGRVIYYEIRINKDYKKLEEKKEEMNESMKGRGILREEFERRVQIEERRTKSIIEKLERKRKFALEKLPLLKIN